MKPLIDLHTHTISSGHAFSTLKENIEEAQAVGLKVLGTSDHAIEMPGTAHPFFFQNYKVIPEYVKDVRILRGIEANIMDYDGKIDVQDSLARTMDYMIASLHPVCIQPGTVEQNTSAVINAMDNPFVKIIGHPDNDVIPLDLPKVVKAAVEKKVALEVNNSSLDPRSSRKGARENILQMLELAKEQGAYIIMGTDSHICYQIGKFDAAMELLQIAEFPEELVINYDLNRLEYVLI